MNVTSVATATTDLQNEPYPDTHSDWFQEQFEVALRNARLDSRTNIFVVKMAKPYPELLSEVYLNAFTSPVARQHFNCSTCHSVINTIGTAVTVNEDGTLKSLLWNWDLTDESNPAVMYWAPVVTAIRDAVEAGAIVDSLDVHLESHLHKRTQTACFGAAIRGKRRDTGGSWTHISAIIPFKRTRIHMTEEYRLLNSQLYEFRDEVLKQSLTLLENDDELKTREKQVEAMRIFKALVDRITDVKNGRIRANLIWAEAAKMNKNITNFTNTVTGQFVEQISLGNRALAKSRLLDQTRPEKYMRPTEAPNEGNVQEAIRLVKSLGISEEDLVNRRMATFADIQEWRWRKPAENKPAGSVFDGLAKAKPTTLNTTKLSFSKTLLSAEFFKEFFASGKHEVIDLQVHVPFQGDFTGYTEAVNPDGGVIYRYDSPERRLSLATYRYQSPQSPEMFGVKSGRHAVEGIVRSHTDWFKDQAVEHVVYLVKSKAYRECAVCLFPESLRHELHPVRATMEALMGSHKGVVSSEGVMGILPYPGTKFYVETTDAKFEVTIGRVS